MSNGISSSVFAIEHSIILCLALFVGGFWLHRQSSNNRVAASLSLSLSLRMAKLEIASIDPDWRHGVDLLPHARDWHPLSREKSDEIRSKGVGAHVFVKHPSLTKYEVMAPVVDLELYRLSPCTHGVHKLVRPCGHMVAEVVVQGNTITARSMAGNILVKETFDAAEHIRVLEFKHICRRKLLGLNKLSVGSAFDLVRADQTSSSSSLWLQPRVLIGSVILKAGESRPKRWSRPRHLKVMPPQTQLGRFFKRLPRKRR